MQAMYELLGTLSVDHAWLAILLFVVIRASSVVWPPIPGFPIDLLGIDLFGPVRGFFLAEAGILVGAIAAFAIARGTRTLVGGDRLGREAGAHRDVVSRLVSDGNSQTQFIRWLIIRLLTNPFFDALSYGAGFTKTRFKPYVLASLLGNVPSMAIFYYLDRNATAVGTWTMFIETSLFLVVALGIAVYVVDPGEPADRIDP